TRPGSRCRSRVRRSVGEPETDTGSRRGGTAPVVLPGPLFALLHTVGAVGAAALRGGRRQPVLLVQQARVVLGLLRRFLAEFFSDQVVQVPLLAIHKVQLAFRGTGSQIGAAGIRSEEHTS